jgi:hypothetical protein
MEVEKALYTLRRALVCHGNGLELDEETNRLFVSLGLISDTGNSPKDHEDLNE